jgi:hypothetical protein
VFLAPLTNPDSACTSLKFPGCILFSETCWQGKDLQELILCGFGYRICLGVPI